VGMLAPRTLSLEDRRLAGLVSKQVAIVIERSRLYERLKSANEKLEQINHLKNEFISMVSHELRTPLTTIKGFVSIVSERGTGPLNDQQRHFLETSDRGHRPPDSVGSDLSIFRRIEAGQIKMQLRPVSLRDVCERMSTSFAPQLKAQNLQLTLRIPEALPAGVGRSDRIGQVLDNLISNALKFTTKGGITISAVDKGDYVMVSVKDTGSGSPRKSTTKFSISFTRSKWEAATLPKERDWDWPSSSRLSRAIAAKSGWNPKPAKARNSALSCPARGWILRNSQKMTTALETLHPSLVQVLPSAAATTLRRISISF